MFIKIWNFNPNMWEIEDNQLVIFDMKNISRGWLLGVEKRVRSTSFFNAFRRIRVRYFSYQK